MELLNNFVNIVNEYLWGYILIIMLITIGVYSTFKMKFVQLRLFKEMFRLLSDGIGSGRKKEGKISSFQAFCISTASSFVESTLAQIYKIKEGNSFRGGPAYFMEKGLKKKWMGITFSVFITLCFGFVFNAVQANTVSLAFNNAFGVDKVVMGVILSFLTAVVIFGGIHRVAQITEIIVPIFAVLYILVSLFIVARNITLMPSVITDIFTNAAAIADVSHPVKQGLIQSLGVFTDTIIICSCTSFMVLLYQDYSTVGLTGIELTQAAISYHIGTRGYIFIAVCIFLFAFSLIVGNYYYG